MGSYPQVLERQLVNRRWHLWFCFAGSERREYPRPDDFFRHRHSRRKAEWSWSRRVLPLRLWRRARSALSRVNAPPWTIMHRAVGAFLVLAARTDITERYKPL